MSVATASEKGTRPTLEDRHLVVASVTRRVPATGDYVFADGVIAWLDFAIFGILLGHGGKLTLNFVRDNLPSEVKSQIELMYAKPQVFESPFPDVDVKDVLTDDIVGRVFINTIQKLDTRIALEIPSGRDGCCLCLVVLPKLSVKMPSGDFVDKCCETVYCVNLGDGGAYLCRRGLELGETMQREGSYDAVNQLHAIPLSEPHKPFVLSEKQRILMSGGTIENAKVNGALKVTRSLGDLPLKKFGVLCTPTFKKFTLSPFHDICVVVANDPFFVPWTPLEALKQLYFFLSAEAKRLSAPEADPPTYQLKGLGKKMMEAAYPGGKLPGDNVTFVVLNFLPIA
eukprot:Blabericola_migrator_1__5155@NODE_265_length_10621_cov_160_318363_g221_i0_p6_GENE_NODE_265_length_10621_cov_160_318363_g221_i0NODE_265_length_10621_cov_160_318363_g221_i0_p6_ORF_typecomplete_len341_score70_40PP2C/PF00481_21/3_9e31PP2C_2/PF13672_6/0_0046_NODE_265_length_10621_cov_160_318363_g221_i01951217